MALAGYEITVGLPPENGLVAIWGRRKRAARGRFVARKRTAEILTVEDGFLRSVLTGREGEATQSLVVDHLGIYFDSSAPSDLEELLNNADLGSAEMVNRSKAGIARLRCENLSKYNGFDLMQKLVERDYVLVIDQTKGDASISYGNADATTFEEMLKAARAENPDSLILIKTHPEVVSGKRIGHYLAWQLDENMRLIGEDISPWLMLENAAQVYCVTSYMGFEAILAGHRPRVFGRPFYGGWGLSEDVQMFARRDRRLSREEMFAAVLLLYPKYYDPYRHCLCSFETALDNLAAQVRAYREDLHGYTAFGMRLWKRGHLKRFFTTPKSSFSFEKQTGKPAQTSKPAMVWSGKESTELRATYARNGQKLFRLEDGFLRSKGLGADLVPPMSLVLDDLGIYYDPTCESRLEVLLNASPHLDKRALDQANNLRRMLVESRLSKYNIGAKTIDADWPEGKKILVPGQVEDDASILKGTSDICRNLDLLKKTRFENPSAFIVYKPHPDVEAGLRKGKIPDVEALQYADVIAPKTDAVAAIMACDEVWTMTSLLGFEALLRDKRVTCLGMPFYAGWGLTHDFTQAPARRKARPSLNALIHAVLIDYPRYFDPVTGLACPVEVVVERLTKGDLLVPNRGLAKLQGVFASFAPFWR